MAMVIALAASSRPPTTSAASAPFTDIAGTTFAADIEWLWEEGVTAGCTASTFCPNDPVTRGQMASFLVRMFKLTDDGPIDAFTDDNGTTHEIDINRVAHAGITKGCTATTFCPSDPVTRGQVATFLVRAVPLSAGAGNDYFRDDDGTTHERDIDRAAAAGIALGCGTGRFCPRSDVQRGQMAAFLHRVVRPVPAPPYPAAKALTLHVATPGTDGSNECLDAANPCRSLGHALGQSAPGDTLAVGPGRFDVQLVIRWDLTIRGDPAGTTFDATPTATSEGRHFWVSGGVALRLDQLTLTNGHHRGGGSAVFVDVGAALVADHVTFSSNNNSFYGGAIWNAGDVAIRDSSFINNGGYRGGAIANGWGLAHDQTLTISGSTFAGNIASDHGGAIWNDGILKVSNSTFVDNTAPVGAAIRDAAVATVIGSTITGNTSTKPFGALAIADKLVLTGSIVAGNAGGDVAGSTDRLASIVGVPAGLTLADILDPAGPADNGGPTQTIALTDVPSNPAIDKGHAATCAATPVNGLDQRGEPRTPPCDIGAYELQP